ncbi:hypothetical protein DPMN_071575 [Dreissena polymorpha]|uniref:Uncharacterized protein n=1 Tax=Dreissena polymorpha TaxID=45954 RepID=A0A9D3Z807_DREPO|nr:hypothetical protein DPMN_071575 [Dreissena polymorpha]
MGNCLCKCKRNEEEVDESAEERESRERRRKVIADLVKLAVNDYGLTRVMENGFGKIHANPF